MAAMGGNPYAQFNFLVKFGDGDAGGVDAGFQECSNTGMGVTAAEYRRGHAREDIARKVAGLKQPADVTLKRGLMGSSCLYDWLKEISDGNQDAERAVTIRLQNEDHTEVVQTWELLGAHIIKYVSGPVSAEGADVAVEELTLAYERLEMG